MAKLTDKQEEILIREAIKIATKEQFPDHYKTSIRLVYILDRIRCMKSILKKVQDHIGEDTFANRHDYLTLKLAIEEELSR